MTDTADPKRHLQDYLRAARNALLWKVEGVSERDLRLPRTPTGTNLIGVIKHCANVESGYFGPTFGRPYPHPEDLVPIEAFDTDPQADWYATEQETSAGLIEMYRRVQAFADETIDRLPLDASGRVPWWSPERGQVTLHHILIHVIAELNRHAGQADLLREQVDGAAGLRERGDNLPEVDWPAYVAKLTALADRY